MCGAGRSVPSRYEMVTVPGFSSPNQPDQERIATYRASLGPASRPASRHATVVRIRGGHLRFVPVKTAEQQAALMLVGVRDRLIRNRTQLANANEQMVWSIDP